VNFPLRSYSKGDRSVAQDLAELARVVADQIEDPRLLLILDVGERVERRLVSAFIGKSARFIVEILLGRRCRCTLAPQRSTPDRCRSSL